MCIRYDAKEWELVEFNCVLHRPFHITFQIYISGDDLAARVVHVADPDRVLQDDVDELSKLAVRAYWDVIGFGKYSVVISPKPN